jgi:hypothetical protein
MEVGDTSFFSRPLLVAVFLVVRGDDNFLSEVQTGQIRKD